MRVIGLLLAALLMMGSANALAATEPKSKQIEESYAYEGPGIRVQIDRWHYAFGKTGLRFLVANVWVDDPSQLQTAFAGEAYSKDDVEVTSAIAGRHGAVIAVNGDYYNYRDGQGLVIRNGVLYRDEASTRDQLLIYADGRFEALRKGEFEPGHGEEYVGAGVVQSMTFGPLLVDGGEAAELPAKYIIYTKDTVREPRTGIGFVDENHYVLLVADGRRKGWSDKDMTLQEMQRVFIEQGCRVAYNLDGGGSASMVLCGEVLCKPSGSRERCVSDIIYFTCGG